MKTNEHIHTSYCMYKMCSYEYGVNDQILVYNSLQQAGIIITILGLASASPPIIGIL